MCVPQELVKSLKKQLAEREGEVQRLQRDVETLCLSVCLSVCLPVSVCLSLSASPLLCVSQELVKSLKKQLSEREGEVQRLQRDVETLSL